MEAAAHRGRAGGMMAAEELFDSGAKLWIALAGLVEIAHHFLGRLFLDRLQKNLLGLRYHLIHIQSAQKALKISAPFDAKVCHRQTRILCRQHANGA
jgi:hypothetical protein